MLILGRFSKVFELLGKIGAFFTVALIGIIYFNNGVVHFIGADTLKVMTVIKEYAVLFTLVLVGLSVASKRGLIIFVVWCVLAALAIGFSFPAIINLFK
ncbi:MAG: hypothetical protein IK070_03420 [Clostridia bacterium]|nr:hypothetical protein [Clostridia bacterium]